MNKKEKINKLVVKVLEDLIATDEEELNSGESLITIGLDDYCSIKLMMILSATFEQEIDKYGFLPLNATPREDLWNSKTYPEFLEFLDNTIKYDEFKKYEIPKLG